MQPAVFGCCPFTLASTHCSDAGIQEIIPSIPTLLFRSTRNHRGNSIPFLATVLSYCYHQPTVFDCSPSTLASTHCNDVGIEDIFPSVPTLLFCSTRNQRRNCTPVLATVRFDCLLQLDEFAFCPFARIPSRSVGIEAITPSTTTLSIRSTQNERGNCNPIYPLLLAVLLPACFRNRTSQLCIFF
jgi:hypothetical protein